MHLPSPSRIIHAHKFSLLFRHSGNSTEQVLAEASLEVVGRYHVSQLPRNVCILPYLGISHFRLLPPASESSLHMAKASSTRTSHSTNNRTRVSHLLYNHLRLLDSSGSTRMAYSSSRSMGYNHILHVEFSILVYRIMFLCVKTETLESSHHYYLHTCVVSGVSFTVGSCDRRQGLGLHGSQVFPGD